MSKTLKNLFKILISAGLLLFLLSQIDLAALMRELASAQFSWLLVTFALFASSILVRAVRWQILLKELHLHVPFILLSKWYYIGAFFNTILPTGFGGDVVRTVFLAQYSKQAPSAAGTVILDRFLGILVLLGIGALAIPFSDAEISVFVRWGVFLLFMGAAIGFWLLRQARLVRWFKRAVFSILPGTLTTRLDAVGWLRPFYVALQGYSRSTLLGAIAISIVFNLIWILTNLTAGLAVGIEARWVDYLIVVPVVSLALLLPSFGGIGVRELSYVGMLAQLGVPAEKALAMSIIIYGVTIATGLIGGILYLVQNIQTARSNKSEDIHPV